MTAAALSGPVLVTGTDTGVGKTVVTAAVAVAATAAGRRVAVVKPAQTGGDCDAAEVVRLAAPDLAVTLASYPAPLAPLVAARAAGLPPLRLSAARDRIVELAEDHDLVLVEGAGGLLVPMGMTAGDAAGNAVGDTDGNAAGDLEWTVADLAADLAVGRVAPVVVVTRAGLGTLNHTALTCEALARRGLSWHLVVGSWPAEPAEVHRTNLARLAPQLAGVLPAGAANLPPDGFRRTAPAWLTPVLYGTAMAPAAEGGPGPGWPRDHPGWLGRRAG